MERSGFGFGGERLRLFLQRIGVGVGLLEDRGPVAVC